MRRDALQARRSAVASTTRRLAYEVRGDGPPLVAPAWWASHLELDWQSPDVRRFWEGVAKDHTLIHYDRLGVGMSDRTVRDFDLTLDGEVATLRTLLDELDLDRVTLIGGSSGTCTASHLPRRSGSALSAWCCTALTPWRCADAARGRGRDRGGGPRPLGTRLAPAQ
jgi:pimeloyl-ACP methyl ester carboxylesterase